METYITFNHNNHRYSVNSETRDFMVHEPTLIGKISESLLVPAEIKVVFNFNKGTNVLNDQEVEALKRESKEFVKLLNHLDYLRRTKGKFLKFVPSDCKTTIN